MHVRSFGVMAVIGVVVAVGCKGGGGEGPDGNFVPGDYETPPGSYDTPGSTWDQPPVEADTPPSGFDTPPDDGSGNPASTRRVCESMCRSALANGCSQGSVDQAGCAEGCSEELAAANDACLDEVLGLLDCVLRSPTFYCGLLEGEVDEDALAACELEALDLGRCYDQEPSDPDLDPDGGFGGAGNF